MDSSRNRCSSSSSCTSPTSSPTSSTPSQAFPPTPTTRHSSAFVDVARRKSEKKTISSAGAKLAVPSNRYSLPPDCLNNAPPVTSRAHRNSTIPTREPPTSKLTKPSTPGPLSRLRDRFPSVKRSQAQQPVKDAQPRAPRKPSSPSASAGSSFTIHRPQKNESRCLQFVMPGLYIAFEDDQVAFGSQGEDEELRTHDNQRFTHIIRLTKLTSTSHTPSIKYTVDRHKTKRLSLSIFPHSHVSFEMRMRILSSVDGDCDDLSPQVAQALYDAYGDLNDPTEGVTLLTAKQLLASRNFLYATGYDLQHRDGARILITAPRDHRTDVVSVLTCYLAYASRNHALTILTEIEKHQSILSVWKGVVSKEGAEVIQEIISTR